PVEGPWSLLAASAHKWGGPGGVGLLAVRKGVRFAPRPPLDERESGWMPGTANLPAIVAAVAALRAVRAEAAAEAERLHKLVELVRARVPHLVPDTEVVGHPDERLPHLVTFSCLYADGESLLHALDRAGFSVSSGSSCTSSTLTPSHVLRAMGVLSEGNVRVSLPRGTTSEDVAAFLGVLPEAVRSVRDRLGVPAAEASYGGAQGVSSLTVDCLGRRCPVPVIELAKVIDDVPVGGVVTVLADDRAALLDIPAWCAMRGHEYVGSDGDAHRVRRSAPTG
ncbi:aminotransferase class V-fold PLP-dependent enzyme, partial [Streptomyces sparsus]